MREQPLTDVPALNPAEPATPLTRRAFCGLLMAGTALAAVQHRDAQRTRTHAIRAGTLYPISGPPIKKGVVLVQDGKITALGASVAVPSGTPTVEVKTALPGLVDP